MSLSVALRSGVSTIEALERVSAVCPVGAGRHLATVAAALRWGQGTAEAWAHVPDAWGPAAAAWAMAERAGAPPADLLAHAAERVRQAESRRVEAATARAGVLLVLPLGLCFLPAFAGTTVVPVVLALVGSVTAASG